MRWGLLAAVAAAALALAPAALADDLLTLQPGPSDSDTSALWQVQQGLPDSAGVARQALVLHNAGVGEAAVVFLRGAEGQPLSWLTSLQWEKRDGSICTTKDPRWTIGITAPGRRELRGPARLLAVAARGGERVGVDAGLDRPAAVPRADREGGR